MADGGFLVKFDGKEVGRCYSIAFNYDEWKYKMNIEEKELPPVDVITIIVEHR